MNNIPEGYNNEGEFTGDKSPLTSYPTNKILEGLADLETEFKDAQMAFDNDWYSLVNTMNFIQKSFKNMEQARLNLEQFKKDNNL